jgi:hypothetical protein
MAQELSDLNEVDVTFAFLKADGTPGDIDLSDPPVLESSDTSAATGVLAADAKSAVIRSGDNLPADKPVTFTLKGVDVDLGAGVVTIDTSFDLVIKSHTAGQVSTINTAFGVARPKA